MELNPINIYEKENKISKYELEEIFFIQYNDLFNKLLTKSIEDFFILLKKQILLHLKIIDKQCNNSLLSFYYEKYYDLCKKDKFRIQTIYDKIMNNPNNGFIVLNTLDIYIHCYKCKDAIHKCGNKLITVNNLYFCLYCKKVYNQHHIKLFCKECNKTYLTKQRTISERKNEYFYSVSFTNYHCYIENEEKIKCLNCGEDLYYNITKIKDGEQKGIRDIYCIKCKLIFDTKNIYFKCKICGDNFKCEPQIFRNFSSIKKYLLLLVHTFCKGIYAIPNPSTNKKCNCDINGVLYFLHHDNGILYQGKKNGKKVIICDCCYGIFKFDNFNWHCPFCLQNFRTIKVCEEPNNSMRIIRKKKKLYTPISNINMYNDLSNIRKKVLYNNDFYNSVFYPKDNVCNSSNQLIQSVSFVHNRGLSLNNEDAQRRYFNLVNNKNNNINIYKSSNRIILKPGNSSRNSDFNNDYPYDRKPIKTENESNLMKRNNKNTKFKKYVNKENIDSTNLNNGNSKILTNLNNSTNINSNINISGISNINNIKKSIEVPLDKKMMMKGSKSVNNLKKKVKIGVTEPNNNLKIIKNINEKNITDQNQNKEKYNNNISGNNNLTQIHQSNINYKKNKISFSQNIIEKNIDKYNNNKNFFPINNKNNNDIYQKKIANEKNIQDKNKRINIDLNKYKQDNNNIIKEINYVKLENSQDLNKNDNRNNIRIFKSNNIINEKNSENKIIKTGLKKKEVDSNINCNIKNQFINKKNSKGNHKYTIILTKNDEINKTQEDNIIHRNKILDRNNVINKNSIQENKLYNNKNENNKIIVKNESYLERNNVINNEIVKTNINKDINNNNVIHISINKKENKHFQNQQGKENKKLNNPINKNMQKEVKKEITEKNNINEEKTNNNNKLPLDSNREKQNSKKCNNHKKNLSINFNNLNNSESHDYKIKKFENSDRNKRPIIQIYNNQNEKIKNINKKENKEIKNSNNESNNIIFSSNENKNINNKNINNSSNNILINNQNLVINSIIKQNINKSKNNIFINNHKDSSNSNNNISKNYKKIYLRNDINLGNNSGKNNVFICSNKINNKPQNHLSKSINFNSYNNTDFNSNRSNYLNKNIISESDNRSLVNNNNINISQSLNFNNNGHKNYIYKVGNLENNANNRTLENNKINKVPNDNYINSIYKSDNKLQNIIYNVNNNIAKLNIIDIKHNNNLNSCSINSMLSNNETLNTTINNKLGNISYNSIIKSTNNNNLLNSNINSKYSNIDNQSKKNMINNQNNSIAFDNDKVKNNFLIHKNNNKIIKNDNEDKNIIYDNDDHPKDSVRIFNSTNNNINKNNNPKKIIINDDARKPKDNTKNNINNIIITNNNSQNNLVSKQKIENNSKSLLKLKKYFSQMVKVNEPSIKRRLSFDWGQSSNHFKLLNNQQKEEKTFDSNYYKIIRPIGKGTYGEIYLVQDPKTLALFALKKIIICDALELKDNQEEFKLTWKLTNSNPELKIAKKFAIEIKKLDKYNLVMYILMEAANCDWEQELLNRQNANAFYTENELLNILKSLVNTLAFLQKKGISHRDVKPQNILCFGNQGYKLTDFGEAKKNNQQIGIKNLFGFEKNTTKQTVRGTELYMSPILFRALQTKVVDGAQYNAYKSDVFSLGMCFLLASSLNYHSLFEIREVLDMNIIEKVVNKYLGKLYSKNYINLIVNMLQIDEGKRPDFIELNKALV